jgi:hypothetical protein
MIGVTSALIGLAAYFLALFVFGLLWRRHKLSQKIVREKAFAGRPISSQPAAKGGFAHLG